jgi:hypothetical protein
MFRPTIEDDLVLLEDRAFRTIHFWRHVGSCLPDDFRALFDTFA